MAFARLALRHDFLHIVHMKHHLGPGSNSMSINVRISGALRTHVERTTAEGDYESVSEYVRDLIRRDKSRREDAAFERTKAHLRAAFSASRTEFQRVSADDVRALANRRLQR